MLKRQQIRKTNLNQMELSLEMLRTQRILEFEKFDVYNMRGQPLQIKEGRNSHRSSQFRGVSKNGKKWQVRIVSAHNLFLL